MLAYEMNSTQDWKLLGSAVVGAAAFPSLLGFFQHAVFKPLRLSSNLKYTSSVLGCASVTLASYGASWVALRVIHLVRDKSPTTQKLSWSFVEPDVLLSTLGSVIIFRALGGKFSTTLPSHLLFPGAFAMEWIPALRSHQTKSEKEIVRAIGQKHGCHSCGQRKGVEFVTDHQPPSKTVGNDTSKVTIDMTLQRLYPQCLKCSRMQGGMVAIGKNHLRHRKAYVTHASNLRLRHAFLPLPLALFYTKEQISRQNREQFIVSAASADQPDKLMRSEEEMQKYKEKQEVEKQEVEKQGQGRRLVGLLDSDLLSGFPLLIIWQKVARFLESFPYQIDAFHLTLWSFCIIAALGTI